MAVEIKVPAVGESINEVEIGEWRKKPGERVEKDESVVTLESEKATVDLPAPIAGTLSEVRKKKGETATIGEVIGYLDDKSFPTQPGSSPAESDQRKPEPRVMPAAQRALAEHQLKAEDIAPSGPGDRLLKEDVLRHAGSAIAEPKKQTSPAVIVPVNKQASSEAPPDPSKSTEPLAAGSREEEVVPMTRLRRTLADRLVQAQHNAALLTTFNEIDMASVMALRKEFGEAFLAKHGTKLGFMSFFVKATIEALRVVPQVNAEVRGTDIVYHNYFDIGVAVGSGKGLVVPVLRNAERMSFAEIEIAIGDFGKRAKENKLKLEELQGGTFTISNGGVYGSLLSTPIINPPQSGILGMHAIQDRPVARENNVVIRPMMYVALTYDHRIVDGREAVAFLRRIKDIIETPARMLLDI